MVFLHVFSCAGTPCMCTICPGTWTNPKEKMGKNVLHAWTCTKKYKGTFPSFFCFCALAMPVHSRSSFSHDRMVGRKVAIFMHALYRVSQSVNQAVSQSVKLLPRLCLQLSVSLSVRLFFFFVPLSVCLSVCLSFSVAVFPCLSLCFLVSFPSSRSLASKAAKHPTFSAQPCFSKRSKPRQYLGTTLSINFADSTPRLLPATKVLRTDMKSSPW